MTCLFFGMSHAQAYEYIYHMQFTYGSTSFFKNETMYIKLLVQLTSASLVGGLTRGHPQGQFILFTNLCSVKDKDKSHEYRYTCACAPYNKL